MELRPMEFSRIISTACHNLGLQMPRRLSLPCVSLRAVLRKSCQRYMGPDTEVRKQVDKADVVACSDADLTLSSSTVRLGSKSFKYRVGVLGRTRPRLT
jgi:hypothetical protein